LGLVSLLWWGSSLCRGDSCCCLPCSWFYFHGRFEGDLCLDVTVLLRVVKSWERRRRRGGDGGGGEEARVCE
jgi:hypothetical protein